MLNIKSAIFDVDGTLLNSMHIWENVAADYLRVQGITPRANLNADLIARGGHEMPRYFQEEYGLRKRIDEIERGMYKLLEDFYFLKAQLKAGVISVLDAFLLRNIRMCVATATDRWLVEPALRRCGILDYFERVFTCGEEKTNKRSPEIYLRAAKYLKTDIADTLVVEDAPYAIETAKRAGFRVAAVYDLSADGKQDEVKKTCDYYFVSIDEMITQL